MDLKNHTERLYSSLKVKKLLYECRPKVSQVYLSLFCFSVFAFTLDICFYFENIRAKVQ